MIRIPAYKYTLKSGKTKWYANFYYTDWTGERKHVCKRGFTTKREALEYERNFTSSGQSGSDILFSNLVENYLDDMRHRLKPTTMGNKEVLISTKILPYFSNLRVCDIDAIKVRKWQNEMLSIRQADGHPYSQTYLKTVNNQLSAIMNYAVAHYNLDKNPCRLAGSIGKSKASEMRFWTKDQYKVFRKHVKKTAFRVAFDILFYSGIREGELLALTKEAILPDCRLYIFKNFARVNGKDLMLIPKTEKSKRKVSIPKSIYDELNNYISSLYGFQDDDRIFYFTKSGLSKEMKHATELAGLPQIRVHDLRHSNASMLINEGVDIKVISERLGHESVKTTWDIYSHLYPDNERKMQDILDNLAADDITDSPEEE